MTTLDAYQIEDIRDQTGADDIGEYSDAKIQVRYDEAVTDAPTAAMQLPYAYVYILRRLWAIRTALVDRLTDHGNRETFSQKRDATKALLDYWEKYTGLTQGTLGTLQVGTIDLNIDYEQADFDAEFEVSDG